MIAFEGGFLQKFQLPCLEANWAHAVLKAGG